MKDRFPGHPASVDTLVVIDDDTIITGASDGLLRIVQIQPNKLLGVVGEHEDFPIERIALDRTHRLLGSCSHDLTVKFWDISYLYDEDEKDSEGSDDNNSDDEGEMDITTTTTTKYSNMEDVDSADDDEPTTAPPAVPAPSLVSGRKKKKKIVRENTTDFFDDL